MSERAARIEALLQQALSPTSVKILDESHLHAGHAGARSGGGHFAVTVISPRFAGLSTAKRHRLVYDALGDMMRREIHALSIQALTPDES